MRFHSSRMRSGCRAVIGRCDWAVNSALAQIYRGGAIREIFGRWFGSLGRPGPVMETAFLFGALPE